MRQGDVVEVTESFLSQKGTSSQAGIAAVEDGEGARSPADIEPVELRNGLRGTVVVIQKDGEALISFAAGLDENQWAFVVFDKYCGKLEVKVQLLQHTSLKYDRFNLIIDVSR